MSKALFVLLQLSISGIVGSFTSPTVAEAGLALGEETSPSFLAQVTTDGTVNTQVTQDGNSAVITGGETRGSNLFHSFQDFSVPTGSEGFFDNANDISNIFSRVTGGNISNIDGAIRANGSASLFLINPAGIIFGENSRLDIGGSFYGTSASSVLFEDGEFSAVDLTTPPVLTINAPIGLGFRDNAGAIANNSTANDGRGLEVNPGNSINLLGGDVNFNGGRVTAPGGTINLGGLSVAGEIGINADGDLNFAEGITGSNVAFTNSAIADVSGNNGGLIKVNSSNLALSGASLFLANIGQDLGSENAVAGTIEINTNAISASDRSLIQADNLGTGQAGTINIATDTFDFGSGSAITASTFGIGDAGTINVTARDLTIDFEFSGIYSNVGLTNIASESLELDIDGVVGNAGIVNIDTDTLTLTNGARIITTSIAQGNGGIVNINATGAVLYEGGGETPVPAFGGGTVISGSFSQVQQEGNGNAGEVNITADSLSLIDTGAVLVDNSGEGGDAGDITLNIAGDIFLDQTGLILAQVQGGAVGNGGDINITANSLEADNVSFILADTRGQGNAGNINFDIAETLSLDNGTRILTEVQEEAVGNAGNITINANILEVNNGSSIASQTRGEGEAGDVTITTNEAISLTDASQIISLVENNDVMGDGGNILLTGGELNLTNNSEIFADTSGQGNAGNITLDIARDISLDNGTQIQSQTRSGAVGNAGNITISTGGSLFSTNGNLILADSQAQGNGGSIIINAAEQVLLEGFEENGFPSQIVAGLTREESDGEGGTIEINAGELILRDVAFISSNTVDNSTGDAGNITLNLDSLSLTENAYINVFTANDQNGGAIIINAQTLDFTSGGKIFAATDGGGDAGNINLNISDRITIDNSIESSAPFVQFPESQLLNDLQSEPSGIYANATSNATGNAGNVNIGLTPEGIPQEFKISNNAQIAVNSEGTGSGGNIFLSSQTLELDNNANISAATGFEQGGVITLQIAEDLILNNSSLISAEATNDADGGNVNIDSRFIIAFPQENNDILASAENGLGGDININAESLFGIEQRPQNDLTNDINASSRFSLDGNVNINILSFNPLQGILELPQNLVPSENTVAEVCNTNRNSAASNSLTVTGKGGIIPEPGQPLNSLSVIVNGETTSTSTIPAPIETAQGKIQPARGVQISESGEVILTAYRTSNSGDRTPQIKKNCI